MWWDGKPLDSQQLALVLFCGSNAPTQVLLGAAAWGAGATLVHTDKLGEFLQSHAVHHFICHEVAKWHWALDALFRGQLNLKALEALWALSSECRLTDLQLLDQQLTSWNHKDELQPPSLDDLVRRFDRKKRIPTLEEVAPVAALCVRSERTAENAGILLEMAATVWWLFQRFQKRITEIEAQLDRNLLRPPLGSHRDRGGEGHRRWLQQLGIRKRDDATQRMDAPANPSVLSGNLDTQFGLLGVGIDVQAAIALSDPSRPPIEIDQENLAAVRDLADRHFADASKRLHEDRQTRLCFEWGEIRQNQPLVACDESGMPRVKLQPWKTWLRQQLAQQAEHLRNNLIPAMMTQIVGDEETFDASGFRTFLDRLMDDAGNPNDPVERMLIQQLAMAHFRIGELHIKATEAKSVELVKAYNSAASRLLGEFRRVALAISTYRGQAPKTKPKQKLGVVKAAG